MHVTPVPVLRDHWSTEVSFEDCEIPVENLIGQEGEGFQLAQEWLVRGRLHYAAQAVGVAEEALRIAVDWLAQRETFGAPLAPARRCSSRSPTPASRSTPPAI